MKFSDESENIFYRKYIEHITKSYEEMIRKSPGTKKYLEKVLEQFLNIKTNNFFH